MVIFLIRYLLSIITVGFVLYMVSMFVGLSVGMFFDFYVLLIVLIPTICLSFIGNTNRESLFKDLRNNSVRFGWIGFIINMITMSYSLGMLNNSTLTTITGIFGLSFGTGSISLLYGYLFGYLIFEPLRKYLIKK